MATDYDAKYKQLGRRIEQFRIERGMTQEAVAAKAEISHSYYSRIKDGRNISIKTAINIADALGVSLSELLSI
jgi:transcriptional regulator with XRE-family HTH domain